MSLEQFNFILKQMPYIKEVTLLGRGETLMAPDFYKMLEYGNGNVKFSVVTNGTILSLKNIKRLTNVHRVTVSIDDPTADGYKKLRGACLEQVKQNIINLKTEKPGITVCIQSLILPESIKYLEEFLDLAKEVKVDDLYFIAPIGFEKSMDYSKVIEDDKLREQFSDLKKKAIDFGINLVATPDLQEPRICYSPWNEPRIALNGDIYPCCFIYEAAGNWHEWYCGTEIKVPQKDYILGNVFSGDFKTLWNMKQFRDLRKMVRKTKPLFKEPINEIDSKRKNYNADVKFHYCKTCLWRLNKSC